MTGPRFDSQRTKIVCTLGPATDTEEKIAALIEAGMDVARLNFSHGTHESHAELLANVRRAAENLGVHVAVLQDLQGPKMRLGQMQGGAVTLQPGTTVTITTEEVVGTPERLSTSYHGLPDDVAPGDRIFLDDGLCELRVKSAAGREAHCEVVTGGRLANHVGMNLPGVNVSAPAVTDKDLADLEFGIQHQVEYVALSFVRRPQDVLQVKQLLQERGADIHVVAKLEKPEALEHLDAIVDAADAIMVARGDLGVEAGPEEVPVMQKAIIRKCRDKRVPVITATEMLESMVTQRRPTRAEASDVANAIFDGTDAIMLSGETAAGQYPTQSVAMMRRIAAAAEQAMLAEAGPAQTLEHDLSIADAVTHAACHAATDVGATAVIAATHSGWTARQASKWRPRAQIIAATPFPEVARRVSLYWGVWPLVVPSYDSVEEMIERLDQRILEEGLLTEGDTVVIIAGTPIGRRGTTNLMRLHCIGQ
ncbi:MAG: pyruvate kinase [Armatimonadota bacterium]